MRINLLNNSNRVACFQFLSVNNHFCHVVPGTTYPTLIHTYKSVNFERKFIFSAMTDWKEMEASQWCHQLFRKTYETEIQILLRFVEQRNKLSY